MVRHSYILSSNSLAYFQDNNRTVVKSSGAGTKSTKLGLHVPEILGGERGTVGAYPKKSSESAEANDTDKALF